LLVDGKDIVGISQLTGRVSTMSIARVAFGLSREAREKVEADVTAQAIAGFRSKADFVSRQFGFGGYSIREVSVSGNEASQHMVPLIRMQAAKVADEALPVEAGKASVSVSVNGSVQMSPK
jgi:predicted secreted protein